MKNIFKTPILLLLLSSIFLFISQLSTAQSNSYDGEIKTISNFDGVKVWFEAKGSYLNEQNPNIVYRWEYWAQNYNNRDVCVDIVPNAELSYNVTDNLNSKVFIEKDNFRLLGYVDVTNRYSESQLGVIVNVDLDAKCKNDWMKDVRWYVKDISLLGAGKPPPGWKSRYGDYNLLFIDNNSPYYIDVKYCYTKKDNTNVGRDYLGIAPGRTESIKLASYSKMNGNINVRKSSERGQKPWVTCY